ncbi:MAG TPA: hypothetical protein ENG90_01240 [Gammaproteobacteria bacterium]|nr:hypothetical protein [Gammaproteobacteria bacterium]HDH15101.1 hypothetical protein [Gammaproteobacteria bacterium]
MRRGGTVSTQKKERWAWCLLSFLFLLSYTFQVDARAETSLEGPDDIQATEFGIENFLRKYWSRPLKAQGQPPAGLSSVETSLFPASCGTCHRSQFNDWRESLHARSMGPGIMGQLVEMATDAKDNRQNCIRCHAPLAEQANSLSRARGSPNSSPNEQEKPLYEQGLVCAACHLREYRWYGPPQQAGRRTPDRTRLPHNGWSRQTAFEDSRFCSACHQFDANGFELNGKLLENTFNEWQASGFADSDVTCQSCHMPGRRHLWRGIHDPDMVRSGVTIKTMPLTVEEGFLSTTLQMKNSATGHFFPTYVTPKIIMQIYQQDVQGNLLPGTLKGHIVARKVPLDLSKEEFDTRIAPGKTAILVYRARLHKKAHSLIFRIKVEPDEFYTRFFQALLETDLSEEGRQQIEQALKNSMDSQFILFERHYLIK